MWNGEKWVNGLLSLSDINGINILNPKDGDVLMFDGENWFNSTPNPPILDNLIGVNIDGTPVLGSSLIWNGTEWVNGTSGIPGEVKLWTGSSAPEGWLVADGSAVSRTTYAELFATIGTTYGEGNGSTTFNLPDFSGRAGVGLDSTQTEFNSLGKTGGAKTHTLTVSEIPSHTHTQDPHGHSGSSSDSTSHTHTGTASSAGGHQHTATSSTDGAHTHTYAHGNQGEDNRNKRTSNCCARSSNSGTTSSPAGDHGHALSTGSAGDHSHTVTIDNGGAHTHTVSTSNATAVNNETGGGQAHNNLQPYTVVNYIIRF